mmetsp:Transcript_63930/g.186979  ORF Transcript_63930/g.186979 Transcript_63930/m.186979 type:complete len:231 (+) Transcript_63930:652-1344(+)
MKACLDQFNACASLTAALSVWFFFCNFIAYTAPVCVSKTFMTLPKPPAPSVASDFSAESRTAWPLSRCRLSSRSAASCSPTPTANIMEARPPAALPGAGSPAGAQRPLPASRGPKRPRPSWDCNGLTPIGLPQQSKDEQRFSSCARSCARCTGASLPSTWAGVFPHLFRWATLAAQLPSKREKGPSGGRSSAATTRAWPRRQARCRGTSPCASAKFGSAPFCSKHRTQSK